MDFNGNIIEEDLPLNVEQLQEFSYNYEPEILYPELQIVQIEDINLSKIRELEKFINVLKRPEDDI